MKKLTIALILCVISTNCFAKSYCNSDAQACYFFKEQTGTTVADSSTRASGGTGTFNSSGHPAWSATGPTYGKNSSSATSANYSTSGSAEIITLGTSNNIAPYNGAMTFCTWINPTSTLINGGDPRYFVRGSVFFAGSDPGGFYFQVDGATPLIRNSASSSLTLNSWNHLCVAWDGSTTATNIHMYVNAAEVSYSITQNGSSLTSNAGATTYLGNNSAGTRSCSSKLTDTAFWTRQLSAAEISEIYNYGLEGSQGMFQLFN